MNVATTPASATVARIVPDARGYNFNGSIGPIRIEGRPDTSVSYASFDQAKAAAAQLSSQYDTAQGVYRLPGGFATGDVLATNDGEIWELLLGPAMAPRIAFDDPALVALVDRSTVIDRAAQ